MSKHIEIAKRFVDNLIAKRADIVGVILVGSVARGDQVAFSDIDLRVIVQSREGKWLIRDGSDGWFEDVYIDTGIVAKEAYADVTQVLTHPTTANDMNDAIILHDPTGFLADVQKQVQAVFMQPEWIGMRVKPHLDGIPTRIELLQEAIEANNSVDICIHASRIFFSFALIPLFVTGVSPSSTRNLIQLRDVSKAKEKQLCELAGTSALDKDDISNAISILAKLTDLADTDQWGDVPEYVVQKVEWLAQNGYPQAALHTAWFNCGFRLKDCLNSKEEAVIRKAHILAEEWLTIMGWQNKELRMGKLTTIQAIRTDLEDMAVEYIDTARKQSAQPPTSSP